MFDKTNAILEDIIKIGVPGNDIIIYHNGKEAFRSYRGYSDKENKTSMNGKEVFNLYSASKPLTCTAAMQLVEKGLIKLDAPLCEYIPEFGEMYIKDGDELHRAKTLIKIRDLFCMSAGLDYNTNSPSIQLAKKETEGRCPTVETIKYLAREPLMFEPGTKWNYSLCHDVLAAVVEVASGVRFGEYVKRNIFEPLKMNHSTFLLPDEKLESVCAQYMYVPETDTYDRLSKEIQPYKFGSEYESGGAGCVSTVEDYIKFVEALRVGDVILGAETMDKMTIDMLPAVDDSNYWHKEAGYGYGLGVRCPAQNNNKRTDFGWDGAAGAYLSVDRENGIALFYAMHVIHHVVKSCHDIIEAFKSDFSI